jgi:putative membrane protein
MNEVLLSLAQLVVAVVLSAVAAYLAFYLFQWFTRDLDEWEELRQGNPAVGVVLGGIMVAVALVLRPALSVNTAGWDVGGSLFFRVLLVEALQLAVGLVLTVVTIALALYLFAGLTRGIDEVEELKLGNQAVGWLLAGVVVAVGLLVSQAVGQIMSLIGLTLF